MICMGGGRRVWLSSSGSSSPPLCPDSSFLNFCRNKHTATLSFVFVFILWTCFVCCVFLYHLCIASQGCGQLLPVVPPSGSDWRFLLSVCLSLTQPPHGTGQPALQQTHNYPYCEYIYCNMQVWGISTWVFDFLLFYYQDNQFLLSGCFRFQRRCVLVPESRPRRLEPRPLHRLWRRWHLKEETTQASSSSILVECTSEEWVNSVMITVSLWLVWFCSPRPSELYPQESTGTQTHTDTGLHYGPVKNI